MTCTKTGCHLWIEPYNEWACGDAFEVAPFATKDDKTIQQLNARINQLPYDLGKLVTNVAYFKIVKRSFKPINGFGVKHYTVHDFEEIIGARGEEVEKEYWPPFILITNNFTNHGHSGVPL